MGFHSPFSVLFIGAIVGIFVFAVSSAFTVWFRRNQSASASQGQTTSLSASLMKLAVIGVVAVSIVAGLNAIQPHTLLEQDGRFVAKDLFTVPSRAGFTAAYPPLAAQRGATTESVEQGTVLVTFRPSPNPKELAAASLICRRRAYDLTQVR